MLQFAGILVTVAGLLGWVLQAVIKYFIKSNTNSTQYIEKLVALNQENTTNFVNTINHQRTLDREMQSKHMEVINKLSFEIATSNKINAEIIALLKTK